METIGPIAKNETTTETPKSNAMEKAKEITTELAEEMGIPTWALVSIIIGVLLVVLGICFFCIRRCFRKRRAGKDGKKGMKGVDLKSVQLLGSSYKEKAR